MKSNLFRKEAVEKIRGPEDMNEYIRVLSPGIWLILASISIAIAGLVIFALSTGYPVWDLFMGNTMV